MSFITWNREYSVSVEEIDEQHQHLIDLINRMYEAVVKKSESHIHLEILNELIDYTGYHFNTEETLLKHYDYPELELHKQQHDDLAMRVTELRKEVVHNRSKISMEILVFLNDWLLNHILETDLRSAVYLNSRGVF